MVAGTVGTEILENAGQRRVGHGDLEEVVAEWDLFRSSASLRRDDSEDLPCYRLPQIHHGKKGAPRRHLRRPPRGETWIGS